jgi:HKD family nuclease
MIVAPAVVVHLDFYRAMIRPGIYETLVTELLAERLARADAPISTNIIDLRNAEAADRLAHHLSMVVERVIESLPENERAKAGVALVRKILDTIAAQHTGEVLPDRPVDPGNVLTAVNRLRPDGTPDAIEFPIIPLVDTALLTNAPGEPRVGHQIHTEIASADRIDVVMAFVRRTGIAPLRDALRRHVQSGRVLRLLTTTYTGSTEGEALEWLRELGADVRVSYDVTITRLHAKAWLFHRESGFSTAYVGSSNLTHSAQVSGLDWNVRFSAARIRSVLEKIAAVF